MIKTATINPAVSTLGQNICHEPATFHLQKSTAYIHQIIHWKLFGKKSDT